MNESPLHILPSFCSESARENMVAVSTTIVVRILPNTSLVLELQNCFIARRAIKCLGRKAAVDRAHGPNSRVFGGAVFKGIVLNKAR